MDTSQYIVSSLQKPFVGFEPGRKRYSSLFGDMEEAMGENSEGFLGVLEVYIHQARDIHNICIYQKQDVYSKLCLTSDPENTVSTEVINGAGQNPIFNQNVRLDVRNIESSLKCEVWMLSRAKNFLEDQLLGFALVPLSTVLLGNGKLSQEFPLSSTDLFHSPAGFVQLSLSYYGDSPEIVAIPRPRQSMNTNDHMEDSEVMNSDRNKYTKLEFPDLRILNETSRMVSEYADMQCTDLNSQSAESYITSDADDQICSDIGIHVVEYFSAVSLDSTNVPKIDKHTTSDSTNGSPSPSLSNPTSSLSFCSPLEASSDQKEKAPQVTESESYSSAEAPSNTYGQSVLTVSTESEQSMFQQEIVDMYMKSMQQFTESLAKMKLPMDIDQGTPDSGTASDQTSQASKTTSSRVFYGSRAFF